ncbi:MAG: hypothetical protein AB7P07_15565 [Hyphomonadaceae bacterium]
MRYRIEYLSESTEEDSVCHSTLARAEHVEGAAAQAWAGERRARRFGAAGFQIRDLFHQGRIVALETFGAPISGWLH